MRKVVAATTLKTHGQDAHNRCTGSRVCNTIGCSEGWEANIIVIISRLFSTFSKRAYLEPLEPLSASVSGGINYIHTGAGLCVEFIGYGHSIHSHIYIRRHTDT